MCVAEVQVLRPDSGRQKIQRITSTPMLLGRVVEPDGVALALVHLLAVLVPHERVAEAAS